MTVKELREKLIQFDDDKEIVIINDDGNFRNIEEIINGYSYIKGKVIVIN